MRKIATALGMAFLLACGSSGSGPSGSNGGINGGVAPSGGGPLVFAPADGLAVGVGNTYCANFLGSGTGVNISALFVEFTSYAGACTFLKADGLCAGKQGSATLSFYIANVGLTSQSLPGSGTYTIPYSSSSTLAGVAFEELDAFCADTFAAASVSGTVKISSTSPSVKGRVDVTFWSGATPGTGSNLGSITGDFDVNGCSYRPDLCAIATTAASNGNACPDTGNACVP